MSDYTAQRLIRMALRKLGAIATGETPTYDEYFEGYESLISMLDQWSAEGLHVFVLDEDTHTLSAGTVSYTIGSGATIDTERPVEIKKAFIRAGGLDTPLDIKAFSEYPDIAQKDLGSSEPADLFYLPGYSVGTIYLWPPGGGELHLWSYKPLTVPAALTSDVVFPGEYKQAIVWTLACDLAPEYGKDPSQYMIARAIDAKSHIIGINAALSVQTVKPEILKLTRRYSIDHG